MALKQLLILTENGVKDPPVIRQYSTGFKRPFVEIWTLKIKWVEDVYLQLTTNI